jgi:SSS family solute:Na+ symporter
MQYFGLDYLIVYAFLALSLYIGLRAGRGVKDVLDYVIANRSFGTGALVLTYLATNITGAGVLHVVDLDYSKGMVLVFAGLGVVISYIITALFIAPKVTRFSNCLTMGD